LTEKAFAHWEDATFGLDELGFVAEEFFGKVVKTNRRSDFQMVMWEYFGRLRNGHSKYFDRVSPLPHGGMINLSLLRVDSEWVVQGSDSDFLKPGDLVTSIGGQPLSTCLDELSTLTGITNWRSMTLQESYLLSNVLLDKEIEIWIKDKQGHTRSIYIQRKPIDFEALNRENTTGKWIHNEEIAYIRIPSFNHPKFEKVALELLDEYCNQTH
jgi:carboxyl-terminal processing protease